MLKKLVLCFCALASLIAFTKSTMSQTLSCRECGFLGCEECKEKKL